MLADICICTFRRPYIARTLESLARQKPVPGLEVRIVVADNDTEPSGRAVVLAAAEKYGLDVQYIHAPGRNISIARNACLDYADGDWIAFIDDDETAVPGWLAALFEKAPEADVVFGPVRSIYRENAPGWLKAGDFHSTRVVYRNGRIETGYCGNVLIRRSAIEATGLRFDLACGVSGGEDTVFFGHLASQGLRLAEAPDALAFEPVPNERCTLGWLARRSWRSGQSHATMVLGASNASFSPARVLLSAAKTGTCAAGAAAAAWSSLGWRRWFLRGMLHCGMALRFAGCKAVL